ncbi:MAG TPA: ubiquitin-like domain-containing protein [Mycobacterium sp.]|nr:ubiquitin-like domain-containing protein [Mycobacterium sp.]
MTDVVTSKPSDPKKPTKPEVTVTYNGVDIKVEYNPKAAVESLLEHAMNDFKITENRHRMALFLGATELQRNQSLEDAGVKPGHVLVLRMSEVLGGC